MIHVTIWVIGHLLFGLGDVSDDSVVKIKAVADRQCIYAYMSLVALCGWVCPCLFPFVTERAGNARSAGSARNDRRLCALVNESAGNARNDRCLCLHPDRNSHDIPLLPMFYCFVIYVYCE